MKDIIKIGLALIAAFLIQTSLIKIYLPSLLYINILSLVVIYFALSRGEIHGMLTGTTAGLIQDSFTFTILGINGFSKTILGFLIGLLGKTIETRQLIIVFPIIFFGVLLEILINSLLYYLTGVKTEKLSIKILFFNPILTAFIGSIIFKIIFKLEERWQS